ncbi:endonuclease/exonuclease/phosphatase family protein, partial [Trifolium medium]|nr:endonuclease/exonuclease/phosphatase family protein [Trifolium medium]
MGRSSQLKESGTGILRTTVRKRNNLLALKVGDAWIEGVEEVKKEVERHFAQSFSEDIGSRPVLVGVSFKQLSSEDNLALTSPFTLEETKAAVWCCDGNKSPGPDGFNINFFKSFWHLLEADIVDFMQEFCVNARLPKAITA